MATEPDHELAAVIAGHRERLELDRQANERAKTQVDRARDEFVEYCRNDALPLFRKFQEDLEREGFSSTVLDGDLYQVPPWIEFALSQDGTTMHSLKLMFSNGEVFIEGTRVESTRVHLQKLQVLGGLRNRLLEFVQANLPR